VDIEIDITKEEIEKSRENGSFSDDIDGQLLKAISQMKKFKSQDDILKIIKENREKRQEEIVEKRDKKIESILKK
jgi:hypothetical protein